MDDEQRCGECRWFRLVHKMRDVGHCKHPVTKLRPIPQVMMGFVAGAEYGTKCKCFERKEPK